MSGGCQATPTGNRQPDRTILELALSEVTLNGVRILVVDDEVGVARAVGRTLRGAGAVVDETYGIHDARLRLRESAYSIVITDIDLAGEDGVDLLRAARLADPDTAVVLMTGKPELRSAVDAVNFGAHRYLIKPLSTIETEGEHEAAVEAGCRMLQGFRFGRPTKAFAV